MRHYYLYPFNCLGEPKDVDSYNPTQESPTLEPTTLDDFGEFIIHLTYF